MFETQVEEVSELNCVTLSELLLLLYSSLEENQREDLWCKTVKEKVLAGLDEAAKFQLQGERLIYRLKRAKRRRWVFPASMRPMILKYFHDSVLVGHLWARKNFQSLAGNFWYTKLRAYVRKCVLCESAKPV
jgi:hypothetical protein